MSDMSCDGVRASLSRYLDDRLPAGELAATRAHLGGCAACAAEKEALCRVDAAVAAAVADHPFGDAAVERVLAGLPLEELGRRRSSAEPARSRAGMGLALAAAALMAALGLALTVDPGERPMSPAARQVLARAGEGVLVFDAGSGYASSGNVVREGDRVVAVRTPGTLFFADGTRVDLHADTSLDLRRDRDGGLRLALDADGAEGKLFCEVAPQDRPFRVQAHGLEVEVLGTRFAVEQTRLGSAVTVVEGRVQATTLTGPRFDRRVLTGGYRAEVSPAAERLALAQVEAPRRFAQWLPRLRDEQAAIDMKARPLPAGEPAPTQPSGPAEPTAPVAPPTGLDAPVAPPEFGAGD